MKLVMIAILLMLACSFLNAQQPAWKEFRSNEGGFSVLMPDVPTPNKVSVNTASGTKAANMFTLNDKNSNEYIVAYSNYQNTNSKAASADKLFNNIRDGILLVQQGKLISETDFTLDGHKGREIVIERPDGVFTTARFYVVGNRFYQISVETKTNGSKSESTKRFLDSFRLLPIKQQ